MSFTNGVSQALHEEHQATIALMERLQQFIARHRRDGTPDAGDTAAARLLSDLATSMENEVQRHFLLLHVRPQPLTKLLTGLVKLHPLRRVEASGGRIARRPSEAGADRP